MNKVPPSSNDLLEPLTPREANILALILENKTNPEIAAQESLALSSVKWYVNQIFSKLGVKTRAEAIARAHELGLSRMAPQLSRNNLPLELTSFIGREEEIARLLRLVREQPLVTVTGVGGTGKTRLALKAAEKALLHAPPIFPDGIWLVELAPIANHEWVPQAVLAAVGLSDVPGLSPTVVLSEYLRSRRTLIVLDNCEHVVETASRLAHELLQTSPGLHILATSREILGAEGEVAFRCPSLSLPMVDGPGEVAENARSEAVRLFVERAARALPDFSLAEENAQAISRICRRLDGIPLAIELAAARLRLLSVEQISDRLDHVFRLLTGGSRTDMPRHQTLKALIDWSYNLLSEKERLFLLRLSVFAGGWTLEAAEAVCADPPDGDGFLPSEEILDHLGQLVDKSLVEMAPGAKGGSPRYRMLETIRQYAHDRLLESGGGADVRERHLDYFLSLSMQAEIQLRGKHLCLWREKLDEELGNLRLAVEWAESGSIAKGLRLAAALNLYWLSNLEDEGIIWLERLLAAEAAAPENQRMDSARRAARGKALITLADLGPLAGKDQSGPAQEATAIFQELGDEYRIDWAISLSMWSEKDLLEVLALLRKIGDPFYIQDALWPLIIKAYLSGNLVQCRTYAEESLALNQKIEFLTAEKFLSVMMWYLEMLEGNLSRAQEFIKKAKEYAGVAGETGFYDENNLSGWMALFQGKYAEAQKVFRADLEARQEQRFHGVTARVLGGLGRTAWARGEYDLAEMYAQEALRLPGRVTDLSLQTARYVLARTAIVRGQYERAFSALNDSLLNWSRSRFFLIPVQLLLQTFGVLAAAQAERPGQALRAAVLFGAQDFICANLMNVMTPSEREAYHQSLAAVRAALSEGDFAAAWAEGKAMTTSQAIQYALGEG